MRRLLALPFLVLLSLTAPSYGASANVQRAVWIVRDRLATPAGAQESLAAAGEAGLDELLVQVRGRGDAYYASDLVPRAEELGPGFDPLAEVLAGAGAARVLAWMNVFYVWERETPPQAPSHLVRAHPEWVLRDADGRPVSEYSLLERSLSGLEGTYADPGSRGYREHFCQVVREVASRYPIGGVHLDFVRYPGGGFGGRGALGQTFKAAWGVDPALIPEDLRRPDVKAWLRGEGSAADRVLATTALLWAETKAREVTALVRAVRATLDAVRPGIELSAAVFPNPSNAFLSQGQDWVSWAEEGLVQALYPMTYAGGSDRVAAQLAAVRDALAARQAQVRLWAGLGGFIKAPEAVRAEAVAARDLGYEGVCLFDLGSLLRTPGGLPPYAEALLLARGAVLSGRRAAPPAKPRPEQGRSVLADAVRKALGPIAPEGLDVEAAVAARWREFEAARAGPIARISARLQTASVQAPAWADVDGMLQFGGGKEGERAREAVKAAREHLVAGAPFEAVARELARGGGRGTAGALGRRYLRPRSPVDRVLSNLEPGQVSPVVEAPGGFWLFRLERKGPAGSLPWGEAPWSARRQHFREELSRELAASPGAG